MSEFKDKLEAVRFNPGLMVNVALNELESQLTGKGSFDVPDAANPFVYALETATVTSSLAMSESHALLRKQYPAMALTMDELYLHLSDDDFIGRFSSPARTTFELYINKQEVIAKAVPYGDAGSRKLIIPRLTEFEVAGFKFTMQYPVELRVMQHGGMQIVYDATDVSPIQALETNLVTFKEITSRDTTLLMLELQALQVEVTTYQETLNATSVFDQDYSFSDQFYFARVFIRDGNRWTPIKTTHSDQVYDPNNLTAVLKVSGSNLRVTIPVIYNSTGAVDGEIRIDVYTTRGVVDIDLGSYGLVNVVFNDIDDDTQYTSPLNTFNQLQALNPNRVTGGSDPVDFETFRNSIIDNSTGANKVPITDVQLTTALSNKGYNLVSNIDNITNRQFLASRRLSNPVDANVISGAGCLMSQLQLSMEQISASKHVKDNGTRLTILPSQLYQYVNGKVLMMNDAALDRLLSASAETIARSTVENRYLYSPFHYVLDSGNDNFDVRPYYLDQPKITRKLFIGENDSTQLQASVDSYEIERIDDGFRITVKLKSSDRFKAIEDELVSVQLGYKPVGENNYASINGNLIGIDEDERVYQFDIHTRFDIDSQGNLFTTNLSMYDESQVEFSLKLTHDLDISVIVNDSITPGYQAGDLDLLVQSHLLMNRFMVIGRESLTVVFGYDLTDLWHRNRTLLSEASYQKWEENVPYLFEETLYKRDENGQIIISINPDKSLKYEVEHNRGDQVYDANGAPVYRYLKGDVKLDEKGNPVLVSPRKILREFTMFMVDGLYYFTTEAQSVAYRDSIALEIISWINSDISAINDQLLERCELYVYPTTTFGDTTATVRDGLSSSITIDQSLNITYYMPEKSYNSPALRAPMIKSTKEIINAMLGNTTISTSDIIERLKANGGDDVTGIEINGLGGVNNFPIITIEDPAVKLSLRKKLTVLANNDLMVEDDININFLKHKKKA